MVGDRPSSHFKAQRWPLALTYFGSRVCTLSCSHCNVSAGSVLPRGKGGFWAHRVLLRRLSQLGYQSVVFTGGEPTLANTLAEDLLKAKSLGFRAVLFSNGLHMPVRVLHVLAAIRGTLVLSIHGLEKTHDAFVGRTGSFESAIRCLSAARHVGITTEVNSAVGSWNVPELAKLGRHLGALGIRSHVLLFTSKIGRAEGLGGLCLSLQEWRDLVSRLRGMELPHGLWVERMAVSREEWETLSGDERRGAYCSVPGHRRICLEPGGLTALCPIRASNPEEWSRANLFARGIAPRGAEDDSPNDSEPPAWVAARDCPAHKNLPLSNEEQSAWIRVCPFFLERIDSVSNLSRNLAFCL